MGHLWQVFLWLGLGWALGLSRALERVYRSGPTAERSAAILNTLALNVSLPCVAFRQLHAVTFDSISAALLPSLMSWIVFAISIPFFTWVGRARSWSRGAIGALILTCGFGNTSFVGFPLLIALRGEDSLRIGVLADQFGTFLALSTGGLFLAALLSARKPSRGGAARKPSIAGIAVRVAKFPPFIAAILGLATRGIEFPSGPLEWIGWVGATLTPFALLSVGTQLGTLARERRLDWRRNARPIAAGIFFKLLLAPVAIAALYLGMLGARGEVAGVSVLEAAMAPMVTGAVVAREEGLEPELASLLIGIGIPLSLITVPIWNWLLLRIGT